MSRRPSDLPPGRNPQKGGPTPPPSPTRWLPWLIIGVLLVGGLFFFNFGRTTESKADLSYSEFVTRRSTTATSRASSSTVERARSTASSQTAQGGKKEFTSSGPKNDLPAADLNRRSKAKDVDVKYVDTGSNLFGDILLWVLPLVLIVGLFVWISRRPRRARWAR